MTSLTLPRTGYIPKEGVRASSGHLSWPNRAALSKLRAAYTSTSHGLSNKPSYGSVRADGRKAWVTLAFPAKSWISVAVVVFWSPFFIYPRRPGSFWVRGIRLEPGVPKPFQLTSGSPIDLRTVPKRDGGRAFAIGDDVTQSVVTSPDDVGRLGALHFLEAAFKPVTGHIRILDGMPTELSYDTHHP